MFVLWLIYCRFQSEFLRTITARSEKFNHDFIHENRHSGTGYIEKAVFVPCRFQSRFQSRFSAQWNTPFMWQMSDGKELHAVKTATENTRFPNLVTVGGIVYTVLYIFQQCNIFLLVHRPVLLQKFGWTGANSYFTKADENGLCFGAGRLTGCDNISVQNWYFAHFFFYLVKIMTSSAKITAFCYLFLVLTRRLVFLTVTYFLHC